MALHPHERLRVIVVDDAADNADSLAEYIVSQGPSARVAYHAAGALELLAQEPADLAVIDVGLPDMAGHDLAATIRTRFGNSIYIVALTGFSHGRERTAAMHAGCDAFLVKPCRAEQIHEMLERAVIALRTRQK